MVVKNHSPKDLIEKKCQRELTIRWMGSKDAENWNGFNGLNEKSNI